MNSKPVIILVKPQLAMNVGMVARAMLNFDFNNLRIVNPRDHMVIENAISASSGADSILKKALIFSSVEDAVKDLCNIYALSARQRDLNKEIIFLQDLKINNDDLYDYNSTGILFGPERSGLTNDDLKYANRIVNIPTNINFSSLNLAQAVLLVCYELSKKDIENNKKNTNKSVRYSQFSELNHFFNYLEGQLIKKRFFSDNNKKDIMSLNLRNIFLRNNLTYRELKTLYGVVKFLSQNQS